ncbi:MAG: alpha/beta fold hydrolase [Pseudomonadota bacterium]
MKNRVNPFPLADLWCLHGFLGLPEDWRGVFPLGFRFHAPAWLPLLTGLPGEGPVLDVLADCLNQLAADTRTTPGRRALLGYSMGGRIALRMLLQAPKAWDCAILVSTHPGLGDAREREPRLKNDREWARRFRHDPWATLIRDWNAQPVFSKDQDTLGVSRAESAFLRSELALALERGSLAFDEDCRPGLCGLDRPILWVAGANDVRYQALAVECLALNSHFELAILPDAGHRVPWTPKVPFTETVMRFLNFPMSTTG